MGLRPAYRTAYLSVVHRLVVDPEHLVFEHRRTVRAVVLGALDHAGLDLIVIVVIIFGVASCSGESHGLTPEFDGSTAVKTHNNHYDRMGTDHAPHRSN